MARKELSNDDIAAFLGKATVFKGIIPDPHESHGDRLGRIHWRPTRLHLRGRYHRRRRSGAGPSGVVESQVDWRAPGSGNQQCAASDLVEIASLASDSVPECR